MMLQKSLMLLLFLAVTFGVAAFGSQFQPGEWYAGLIKPAWTPPGWIFPPVWTFLYAAMAVAAWLVWRVAGWQGGAAALVMFAGQLVLNGLWSWLFFGRQAIGASLVDIAALLAAVLITAVLFWKKSRPAGGLMLPYLAWLGFAAALNFQIWRLN